MVDGLRGARVVRGVSAHHLGRPGGVIDPLEVAIRDPGDTVGVEGVEGALLEVGREAAEAGSEARAVAAGGEPAALENDHAEGSSASPASARRRAFCSAWSSTSTSRTTRPSSGARTTPVWASLTSWLRLLPTRLSATIAERSSGRRAMGLTPRATWRSQAARGSPQARA